MPQKVMKTPVMTADKRHDRAHGEINAGGNDDKGDAQRQNAVDRRGQEDAFDVFPREEDG